MRTVRLRSVVSSPVAKGSHKPRPYLALEHIESGLGRLLKGTILEERIDEQAVGFEREDVLFGKLRPYLQKVHHASVDGSASGELIVLRPEKSVHSRYLYYCALSRPFLEWAEATSYGVKMPRTSWETLGQLQIQLQPLQDQHLIADFLDGETERIEALVEAKRNLIDLLAEKRTSLITHAVTKGLDPSVPMKSSGIPWIGEIPSHWETQRLGVAMRQITNGYVGPTRDILVDSGVRYIQSLHVKEGRIDFHTPYFVTQQWSSEHLRTRLEPGDLLLVQTGDIGQSAVVDSQFAGSQCHALIIMRRRRSVDHPQFFGYVLRSSGVRSAILETRTGALHPHLNVGLVRDVSIPVPPPREQSAIVSVIGSHSESMSNVHRALTTQLDLLSEYRQAVITAAVTGQLNEETLKGRKPADEAMGMEVPS